MSIEEILATVGLFSEMPRRDLSRLAKLAVRKAHKAGEVIVREGDLGIAFYAVGSGKVEVVKALGTPNELVLAALGPGDFFGEMALFENQVRNSSVRAVTDCECIMLTKWDFNAEVNTPGSRVAVAMLPILFRRIRALDEAAATH